MQTVRFAELIDRHERELYRYAYRMMGNAEDASDVLQEAFLRALKAFAKLPQDAAHRAWLYRITSRVALNLWRSRKRKNTWPLDNAYQIASEGADAETRLSHKRIARRLMEVMGELPPKQRASLLLRKYEGLSYHDVAQSLGISEDSARANVYQAMKKLRRFRDDEGVNP